MRLNEVKHALKAGKLRLGMNFGQLRSAELPKLLAAAGFHWAFIDTEHGNFDLETVNDICRVAQLSGLSPIVRVADLQYSLVARALDCGAQGIIFPRMEDPKLLETALSWTKFPPVRSPWLWPDGAQTEYEPHTFNQVIEHVNANTLTVLQIESRRAVEAREELLSVPGIDAVMIGPADLSISMGVPRRFPASGHGQSNGGNPRYLREQRSGARHPDPRRSARQILEGTGHALPGMRERNRFSFDKAKETAGALLAD